MRLKYLFKATFTDGSEFYQPQDDHSELDSNRSSFYDLLSLLEDQENIDNIGSGKKLKTFELIENKTFNKQRYEVNLINGLFRINGVELELSPEHNLLGLNPRFKLVFFREHEANITVDYKTKDGEITKMGKTEDRISKYAIGWECTIQNKTKPQKFKQLLFIK